MVSAYESLRRFRAERVAQVLGLETPIPMAEGPKFMLHASPVDVGEEAWERVNALPMLAESAANWRFNLDGFVIHTTRKQLDNQSYSPTRRCSAPVEGLRQTNPQTMKRMSEPYVGYA